MTSSPPPYTPEGNGIIGRFMRVIGTCGGYRTPDDMGLLTKGKDATGFDLGEQTFEALSRHCPGLQQ